MQYFLALCREDKLPIHLPFVSQPIKQDGKQ